jgi:predicted HicB family RNase H-like nuclease
VTRYIGTGVNRQEAKMITLRVPVHVHKVLTHEAASCGMSLNTFLLKILCDVCLVEAGVPLELKKPKTEVK